MVRGLVYAPNLQDQWPGFFDGKYRSFMSSTPIDNERWSLFARKGAILDTHIDANGYGTIIQILFGSKNWYYADISDWDPEQNPFTSPKEDKDFQDKINSYILQADIK